MVDMAFLVFIGFLYPPLAWKVLFEARKVLQKIIFRWWLCTLFSSLLLRDILDNLRATFLQVLGDICLLLRLGGCGSQGLYNHSKISTTYSGPNESPS